MKTVCKIYSIYNLRFTIISMQVVRIFVIKNMMIM